MISLKFEGLDRLNAKLRRAAARVKPEQHRFLLQESELLKGRAKAKTPVDTGQLRNGFQSEVEGESAVVGNNTEYAPFVEYPHRVRIHGKFTGTIVPGKFMLRDAVDECDQNFAVDCAAIMQRIFG